MTRSLRLTSSKKKPAKASQELVLEGCNENSPKLVSQSKTEKCTGPRRPLTNDKENVSPLQISSNKPNVLRLQNEIDSPIRKSSRLTKSINSKLNKPIKDLDKSVLCDKTNYPKVIERVVNAESIGSNKKAEIKTNNNNKQLDSVLKLSTCVNNKDHIPIYKTVGSFEVASENDNLHIEKKETIYEFEVDENEEPIPQKKRRKRAYTRKPKVGPKALTINNIKYSSTESLASLPDKPVNKKRATKVSKSRKNLKPFSSVTSLNKSKEVLCKAKSFMSQPSSILLCNNDKSNSFNQLSVLQETISEQFHSPIHRVESAVHDDSPVKSKFSLTKSPNYIIPDNSNTSRRSSVCDKRDRNITPNPKCYKSNSSLTPHYNNSANVSHQFLENNTNIHQISSCLANASTSSSHDFLSSTPCKKSSLVVCNNSVFDESCELPGGVRRSLGKTPAVTNLDDNYFGFDEPEELEEPLVSPIKHNIYLEPKKHLNVVRSPVLSNQSYRPKPSAKEIIDMLKASIPKSQPNEHTEVFDTSVDSVKVAVPSEDIDNLVSEVSFKKPPRRSYERQRRIKHCSDYEDSSEEERVEEEKKVEPPKPANKFYRFKKLNSTKTKGVKKTKATQKKAKEEEEIERLAAQMNAQFQEIEKNNLVVE